MSCRIWAWLMIFSGLPVLNMRSMRSVMKKPPTMLLEEAAMAINAEDGGEARLMASGDDDGADHDDGVERVGERHQRRVQQRRDALDQLEADEARQHEDVQIRDEIRRHAFPP